MAGLAASTPCLAERTPCNDLRPHDSILPWVTASPVHGCEGWPEQPLWVKRRQVCITSVRIGVPASRLHSPERYAHCVCSACTEGLQFERSQFFKHGRFLKAFLSKQNCFLYGQPETLPPVQGLVVMGTHLLTSGGAQLHPRPRPFLLGERLKAKHTCDAHCKCTCGHDGPRTS